MIMHNWVGSNWDAYKAIATVIQSQHSYEKHESDNCMQSYTPECKNT